MSKKRLGLVQFPSYFFRRDAVHVTVAALFEGAQLLGFTFDDQLVTFRVIHPSFRLVVSESTAPFYLMVIGLDGSVTFKPAPPGHVVPLDFDDFWASVDARFDPDIPF